MTTYIASTYIDLPVTTVPSNPAAGYVRMWVDSSGQIHLLSTAGAATGLRTLSVNTTAAGNTTTGEDDLMTYTLAAGLLANTGDRIEFEASGIYAAAVATKQVKVKFGATTGFATGGLAITAATDWVIRGTVIRTGAATQKMSVSYNGGDAALLAGADYTAPTETLSGTVVLKLTGEGVNTDDIIQQTMTVNFYPAP